MHRTRERHGPGVLKRSLHADKSGMALIYVTATLPIIIGFALLAIDASRVYILNSSLQHGADAIALAMAAELDRTSDALTRAERAKNNLVANPATFTSSFSSVDGANVSYRFLKALPANDKDPILDNATYNATGYADANYVEVTVNQATYDTIFPASFINAVGSFSSSATAVAGLQAGACNVVPMFMCNPLEPSGNTDPYRVNELLAHVASTAQKRKLFELKAFASSNQQSQFSPGNFGYVETSLGNGARGLNDAISQAVPGACVSAASLTTKPGNVAVANDAFNVRFDMYKGQFSKSDPKTPPSRNNRKSYTAGNGANGACNESALSPDLYSGTYTTNSPPPSGMGFPRDRCQVLGNCGCSVAGTCGASGDFGGRLGGGDWNGMFVMYMKSNFGNNSSNWPTKADGSAYTTDPANTADLPSRYEVYRNEINQGFVNSNSSSRNKGMAYPACYTGGTPNDSPDRRLIFAALANCIAQPIGSGSTTVKAAAFGLFFLTEPVGSQGSVYAELVEIIKPGSGSGTNGALVADNVQLYR